MLFNRNSLFWKIFLSFWLANIAVAFTATYFALQHNDRQQREYNKQQMVERLGDFVIPLLEQQRENPQFKLKKTLRKKKSPYRKKFMITDDNGQVLIDNMRHKKHDKGHPNALPDNKMHPLEVYDYEAASGKLYKIHLPPNRHERIIDQFLQRMLLYRLLFILLISAGVSYLLTAFITRPLKQLGQQSRAFAEGDFDTPPITAALNDKAISKQSECRHLLQRKDEIGELARDLQAMQLNITQLINDKQSLLHDVSHELRAPLSRLMAASALIQQQLPADSRFIQRIDDECETMRELIDQILHLSRFNQQVLRLEQRDIVQLLQESRENCLLEFGHSDITISCDQTAIFINTDEQLLSMAVQNILRNACQHSNAAIAITVKQQGDSTLICISDDGAGVENSLLASLFQPFTKSPKSHGTGLGLNIAFRAVEKLQGSISAQNLSDNTVPVPAQQTLSGLSITITLPRL